jgi:hypothetical protein
LRQKDRKGRHRASLSLEWIMPLDGSDKCPICLKNFRNANRLPGKDADRISCQLCGTYDISRSARASLRGDQSQMLPYLSAFTRQTYEFDGRIVQLDQDWQAFAEVHQRTSVHRRAEKLLRLIENRTKQPGEFVTVDTDWDYPLVDAANAEPLYYFLKYWDELGCIEKRAVNIARLTVKGWDRLDPGSAGAGIAGRVFIAMSFDPPMDEAYELGIKPAIESDCGMMPIRVDKVHHNEKICDRILAEIRRSQLIVADFTHHKPGVYFEAGFALALGRLVIWACREDAIKHAHFDTRQYPHVVWKDAAELRVKLADRVNALMRGN